MTERLIDVGKVGEPVLHTFPVNVVNSIGSPTDADYKDKALKAAAYARLVPDAELKALTSTMHISRSGPLEPYGDQVSVLSQTKQGLDQAIRERAYYLWQADGRRAAAGDEYWHRAREQHLRERAYVLWQQEGCPSGRADDHWNRTSEFETC